MSDIQVGRIEFGSPHVLDFKNAHPPFNDMVKRYQAKPLTAAEIEADKQRPSHSQQEERTKLAAAIYQLISEFTDKTGLVVEDVDIELSDLFFYRNPMIEKRAIYQAVQIKAVLP